MRAARPQHNGDCDSTHDSTPPWKWLITSVPSFMLSRTCEPGAEVAPELLEFFDRGVACDALLAALATGAAVVVV